MRKGFFERLEGAFKAVTMRGDDSEGGDGDDARAEADDGDASGEVLTMIPFRRGGAL